MADKTDIDFQLAAVKEAFLKKQFLISTDPIYDYYQTNSGMYAKNPIPSGGGGGGGDLDGRVADLEESQARQDEDIENLETTTANVSTKVNKVSTDVNKVATTQKNIAAAAKNGLDSLSDFVLSNDPKYDEIDDIISDQDILRSTQTNFLCAVIDANS